MPAHRRRLRPESTGLLAGTLATVSLCVKDCERTADRLGTGIPYLLRDDRQGMCIASLRGRQTKAVRRHRAGLEYIKDYKDKDRNLMKRKASISHEEAIIQRL